MATKTHRTERRTDALSKERIVEAAIAILDTEGESARPSARSRPASHRGRSHLLARRQQERSTRGGHQRRGRPSDDRRGRNAEPRDAIRAIALGVFDAIDAHPWVGAQLAREPWSAILQIFEGIGSQIQALGVPERAQFDSASALANFILGVAGQNAAKARLLPRETDRSAFLATVAARWTQRDPADYPFVHQVATQLREHDDRVQFLAGIDLFLAGIETIR